MAERQNTLRRCSRCRRIRSEQDFYEKQASWCKDCIRRADQISRYRRRTYPEQEVPRSGGGDPCSVCPAIHNCRMRVRVGLWVMCETPNATDFELAMAIIPGRLRGVLLQTGAQLKKDAAERLRTEYGLPPGPPGDELLCRNCELEEVSVASRRLCDTCYHYWLTHGRHRPRDLARKQALRRQAAERVGGYAARDRKIRRLTREGEISYGKLAKQFHLTPARISQIANQET